MRVALPFVALVALLPLPASGATYAVTPDETGDSPTIQAAIPRCASSTARAARRSPIGAFSSARRKGARPWCGASP